MSRRLKWNKCKIAGLQNRGLTDTAAVNKLNNVWGKLEYLRYTNEQAFTETNTILKTVAAHLKPPLTHTGVVAEPS